MSNDDSDLVWGASNIAKAINRTERQIYHMASKGVLPVHKAGATLVGKRSELQDPARWSKKPR
jgi:hypothetical protein